MPKRTELKKLKDLTPLLEAANKNSEESIKTIRDLVESLKGITLSTMGTEDKPKRQKFSQERYLNELKRERLQSAQRKLVELRFEKNLASLKEEQIKKEKTLAEKQFDIMVRKRESVESELDLLDKQREDSDKTDPLKLTKASLRRKDEGDLIGSWILGFVAKRKGEEKKAREFVKQQREKEKKAEEAIVAERNIKQEQALLSFIEKLTGTVVQPLSPTPVATIEQTQTQKAEQTVVDQQRKTDIKREEKSKTEEKISAPVRVSVESITPNALEKLKDTLLEAFKAGDLTTAADSNSGLDLLGANLLTKLGPIMEAIVALAPFLAGAAVTGAIIAGFQKALNDSQLSYDERRKKEEEARVKAAKAEREFHDKQIREDVGREAKQDIGQFSGMAETAEWAQNRADQQTDKDRKRAWQEIADKRRAAEGTTTPTAVSTSTEVPETTTSGVETPVPMDYNLTPTETLALPTTLNLDSPVNPSIPSKLKSIAKTPVKVAKTIGGSVKEVFTPSRSKQNNIDLVSRTLANQGFNQQQISAILGKISTEAGTDFNPKSETSYRTTPYKTIMSKFGKQLSGMSKEEVDKLKKDDVAFFNKIYSTGEKGKELGNLEGEGYKYRGRGYIQITGKGNYEKLSKQIFGDDRLVRNPDLLNQPEISALAASQYLKNVLPKLEKNTGLSSSTGTQEQANSLVASAIAAGGGETLYNKEGVGQKYRAGRTVEKAFNAPDIGALIRKTDSWVSQNSPALSSSAPKPGVIANTKAAAQQTSTIASAAPVMINTTNNVTNGFNGGNTRGRIEKGSDQVKTPFNPANPGGLNISATRFPG